MSYLQGKCHQSQVIQLKLAWNFLKETCTYNPRMVHGGMSKECWKILNTPVVGKKEPVAKDFMPELTEQLLKKSSDIQWSGLDGADNLWIMKPSNTNRGQHIKVVKGLPEILKHAKCPPSGFIGNQLTPHYDYLIAEAMISPEQRC